MPERFAIQDCATEWTYTSGRAYDDPFNQVELDVRFWVEGGQEWRVPAYWCGGQTWGVRFAPPEPGPYHYRTECSDTANPDLHGRDGTLRVTPYAGPNALLRHGPLRVSGNRRFLEHADGTPFFWLADTWWRSLSARLSWPDGFRALTEDRARKGFSVVLIVAGLHPGEYELDPRAANEGGLPWEPGYERINPAYFDMADLRLEALVRAGIVPCLLGSWGFHARWMSEHRLRQHWRNLVARYGAYPVVWCLAGETRMPYYLSERREEDSAIQGGVWTEVARYVRAIDAHGRLLTTHPRRASREEVDDPALLDFELLQTGHRDQAAIPNTVRLMTEAVRREPRMPVLNGEVCYEGLDQGNREDLQRFLFWACILSGACGHTYGADGIILINTPEQPFGFHPHGFTQGDTPWQEAAEYPGAAQLGRARRFLERLPWPRFESHPEWVEPHWSADDYALAYAAGERDGVRLAYFPGGAAGRRWRGPGYSLCGLNAGGSYVSRFVNPSTFAELPAVTVTAGADGRVRAPNPHTFRDWLLLVEPAGRAPHGGTSPAAPAPNQARPRRQAMGAPGAS
ncbi:MAG: DUF4038 domain-containing protein [Chloroflexota bacterium]